MNTFFSGAGLRRLRVMTHKELLQLFRDVALMVFFLYAFTGDIYIAASGVSMQLKNAAIATLDGDHSLASRELASRFQPPYFQAAGSAGTPQQAIRHLDDGDVMAVLDIPPRFGERLARGEQVAVQLQVDTSNSVLGFLASSYGAQIVGRYGLEVAALREGLGSGGISGPVIQADTRIWYNPNQNDAWFMGISELLTVITLFAILLPAAAMVREKERGTIEQLMVTPLSAFQILFPKVIPMTLVILAGTAIALFGVLGPGFDLPMRGSLVLFFLITALYVFTTAGLGLLAATVARNLAQVGMLTVVILMPMLLLSGAWTPIEAMPEWMRILAWISPLHYFLDAAYGILLKGTGMDLLWDSVLAMGLLGVVVFGAGMGRFGRQFG
ncbi:MAG: ABC transporter permease [Zoogloea sp.]|nr:ABC transporter permease [Zoogloea sp.]